jgi:hypothetical protein
MSWINTAFLQKLALPFPTAIHPQAEMVARRSMNWLARHKLYANEQNFERLARAKPVLLVARIHPKVGVEMLELLADWYLWLYALDDEYCDDEAWYRQSGNLAKSLISLVQVLETPQAVVTDENRFAPALRELACRIGELASHTQMARWVAAVQEYFLGLLWEATLRANRSVPDFAEYVSMRRLSGAIPACQTLMDITAHYEISAAEWNQPSLRTLSKLAADISCWDNDILSYAKEKLTGDGSNLNLVSTLARLHDCSAPEAAKIAVEIRNEHVTRFQQLATKWAQNSSAEAGQYLSALKYWMRGHLEWTLTSSRYLLDQTGEVEKSLVEFSQA